MPLNVVDGVKHSVALTYLASARERANLTIRPTALVDRVLVEDGRAAGVRLADGEVIAAGRVILAAGGYGSPTVLLRSGIGPAAQLRELGIDVQRDLPGVGANLHDHPLLLLEFAAREQSHPLPCQTLLTAHAGSAVDAPDLHIFPSSPLPGQSGAELLMLVALMRPRSRGRLRLASPDPSTAPDIDVGLLTHPDDLPRLRSGLRQARQLAATAPFDSHIESEQWPGTEVTTDEQLDHAIKTRLGVYWHPVSTCRMGPADDPDAVVDPAGRVYGVTGLAVADASIMPSIPSSNTHLPTLAIAEHLTRSLEK